MYYLNYPAIGSSYHINISEDERMSIIKAREYLMNITFIEEKFDFAVGNYYDFQKILLEKSLSDSIRRSFAISEILSCERELTRKLFNLLSTVYAYTEQIQKLKRQLYLSDPEIITKYVNQFEKSNFSTKFITRLRDHIQHNGISTNIELGACEKTDSEHSIRFLFFYNTLYLDIQQCKKDSKMEKLLKNFTYRKDKIEICDHIKYYFKEFCQLHTKVRNILNNEKEYSIKILNDTFGKFESKTKCNIGDNQKLLGIYSDEDSSYSYIFTNNMITEIEELTKYNSNLSNIDSRFACNAAYNQLQILQKL